MITKTAPNLEELRHSLAHLMVAAVRSLYPGAKNAIGPAIENGFYQDFDIPKPITEADLPRIEKKMREILRTWKGFVRREVSLKEAQKEFHWNEYKRELAAEFAGQGKTLTLYTSGNLVDLCRGGHVENPARDIDPMAFKLTKVAGAYWRGNEKNPMLTRIYGVAFATKAELDAHLTMLKEAEARDHRRLGRELDLYSFHAIAPGAVFWHGNGMVMWNELEKLLREHLLPDYQEVQTPLMVKPELFERSGHLAHYKKNMFRVEGRDEELYLKPMNCPEGAVIFATRAWSYRDLPVRFAEMGRIHRNELAGTLGGLFRVRQITQDDGHIYCTPQQLGAEITNILKLSKKIYAIFGLKPSFFLSTKPDDAMGDDALWKQAEDALRAALDANRLPYQEKPKDGTFYAPKIDIDITDSLGRRWQLCTIQADLMMIPSLPGVEYVDEHGTKQKPVVIHRAIFGSFERFMGIILEHFAGNLPTWLSPVQVGFVPVSDKHIKASTKLAAEFRAAGIRASVDASKESVGYKIRRALKHKIPYLLVIGDKELKSPKLSVRVRGSEKLCPFTKKSFIATLQKEIAERKAGP